MRGYYRLLTTASKKTVPCVQKELIHFSSFSYEEDLKKVQKFLRGRRFLHLSKKMYNKRGERIKPIDFFSAYE